MLLNFHVDRHEASTYCKKVEVTNQSNFISVDDKGGGGGRCQELRPSLREMLRWHTGGEDIVDSGNGRVCTFYRAASPPVWCLAKQKLWTVNLPSFGEQRFPAACRRMIVPWGYLPLLIGIDVILFCIIFYLDKVAHIYHCHSLRTWYLVICRQFLQFSHFSTAHLLFSIS